MWTIGFGETAGVTKNTPCISQRKARRMLRNRLNEDYLTAIPRRKLMLQRELDALSSFAYNLGTGAVSDPDFSTLARRLKSDEGKTYKGRKRIYRIELPKWVRAGGVILPGLVRRREAEVRLACRGIYNY